MGMHYAKVISEALKSGSSLAGKAMANRRWDLAAKAAGDTLAKSKSPWGIVAALAVGGAVLIGLCAASKD